jgi:putative transposase
MHLPHLPPFENGTVVFVTTCTLDRQPLLACPESHAILQDVWGKSGQFNGWYIGHYVVMPDHVHFFACPGLQAQPMARWMQLWKSASAKGINRAFGRTGSLWQSDYFDRFMRSQHDYAQKWNYVESNPVRKGLARNPWEWPYRGIIHDLRHRGARD